MAEGEWTFRSAVVDTNVVWTAYSRKAHGDRAACRRILDAGANDELTLYVSTLTFVELFKVPDDEVTIDDIAVINDALTRPGWLPVELDGTIAMKARDVGLRWGIKKPYDCVQLATALDRRADVLITSDASDFELGAVYDGVHVIEPPPPPRPKPPVPTLFDGVDGGPG